jgi:hypothetical protein
VKQQQKQIRVFKRFLLKWFLKRQDSFTTFLPFLFLKVILLKKCHTREGGNPNGKRTHQTNVMDSRLRGYDNL